MVVPGAERGFGLAVSVQLGEEGGGGKTCWFVNVTSTQELPEATFTCPEAGTTESIVHVEPGLVSVIVCTPGVTLANVALPLASLCTVVAPPSSVKVNCGIGVIAVPLGLRATLWMAMQPFCGGGKTSCS